MFAKFLIIWDVIKSVASLVTKFTKTNKDEQVLEKLDQIVANCSSITEDDVAKLKEVTKQNLDVVSEIKNILKK